MDISRRGFIKGASSALALGLGSGALLPLAGAAEETSKLVGIQVEERRRGEMIFRRLGKTDEWVSVIGLGGYHIGKQADENQKSEQTRHRSRSSCGPRLAPPHFGERAILPRVTTMFLNI